MPVQVVPWLVPCASGRRQHRTLPLLEEYFGARVSSGENPGQSKGNRGKLKKKYDLLRMTLNASGRLPLVYRYKNIDRYRIDISEEYIRIDIRI